MRKALQSQFQNEILEQQEKIKDLESKIKPKYNFKNLFKDIHVKKEEHHEEFSTKIDFGHFFWLYYFK